MLYSNYCTFLETSLCGLYNSSDPSRNRHLLVHFCFWDCKEAALSLIWRNFSLFYAEKALVMLMQMLAISTDLYRCILSDDRLREEKT